MRPEPSGMELGPEKAPLHLPLCEDEAGRCHLEQEGDWLALVLDFLPSE